MATSARKFVTIPGFSDNVRIPRLGRIRLGHMNHNTMSGKTNPEEDPYFLVPPEVAEVYGERPTELDIMFPVNDRAVIFPQAYEMYGSSRRLLCSGNGKEAMRWNKEALDYVSCACPCDFYGKECGERAHLMVMLPKVKNQGGVYQIDTGSINSMLAINSTLNILAPLENPDNGLLGYFAMVPMKLRRVPRDIYPNGIHRKSYPLQLSLNANDEEIQELRKRKEEILAKTRCWVVEEPEQVNPEVDPGAIVTIDNKPLNQMADPAFATGLPMVTLDAPAAPTGSQDHPAQAGTVALEVPIPIPSSPTATTGPTTVTSPAHPSPIPATASLPMATTPSSKATPAQAAMATATSAGAQAPAPVVQATRPATPPTAPQPVAPLNMTRTKAQLDRILGKTRAIKIPDEVVHEKTAALTKKQASELITQLDRRDFSFFEKTEVTSVRVPLSA
jgi:hypothetical protein